MSVSKDARKFLEKAAKELETNAYSRVISEDIFNSIDMPESQATVAINYLADAGYIIDLEWAGNVEYPIMFRISNLGYDWLDY